MLYFAPTPIGNLGDISLRVLAVLRAAKIVLCEDTRVAKKLLNLLESRGFFGISLLDCVLDSVESMGGDLLGVKESKGAKSKTNAQDSAASNFQKKEFISVHSHNEKAFLENLSASFFDKIVVFLSDAGMPCISDPGANFVAWCVKNNVAFEVLPGANAALTAFAGAGLLDSQNNPIKEFIFYGFLSIKTAQSELEKLIAQSLPFILYESPKRVVGTLKMLESIAPNAKISAQKELTKLHEKRFYGTAGEILKALESANTNGEWVLVVHNVAPTQEKTLSKSEILSADIPPKPKAKLLNAIEPLGVSAWYERLQNAETKQNLNPKKEPK